MENNDPAIQMQTTRNHESWTERARDTHCLAVHELIKALELLVSARTLATYPQAATLVTNRYRRYVLEVETWHMHAEQVLDADQNIIAGWGDPSGAVDENWEAYIFDVDEHLDEMFSLDDSDPFEGEHRMDIRVAPQPEPPKLVVVDGVAHCSECDSNEFRYDFSATHPMTANEDGLLVFDDDYETDGVPGIVCTNPSCAAALDPSDAEIEWR